MWCRDTIVTERGIVDCCMWSLHSEVISQRSIAVPIQICLGPKPNSNEDSAPHEAPNAEMSFNYQLEDGMKRNLRSIAHPPQVVCLQLVISRADTAGRP